MEKYELIDVEGGYRFRPVVDLFDQDDPRDVPTAEQYRPPMAVITPIDSFDYAGTWVDAGVLA